MDQQPGLTRAEVAIQKAGDTRLWHDGISAGSWALHLSSVLLWVLLTAQGSPTFQPSSPCPALLQQWYTQIPCQPPCPLVTLQRPLEVDHTYATSGNDFCVCFCAHESQEIREEVVWSVLEAGARGKEVRRGEETMAHSTLQHHAQQFQHRQRTDSKPTCPTGVMRPRQGILACAKF